MFNSRMVFLAWRHEEGKRSHQHADEEVEPMILRWAVKQLHRKFCKIANRVLGWRHDIVQKTFPPLLHQFVEGGGWLWLYQTLFSRLHSQLFLVVPQLQPYHCIHRSNNCEFRYALIKKWINLCNISQHNTTQHNTTQHNTTRNNTAQNNAQHHNTRLPWWRWVLTWVPTSRVAHKLYTPRMGCKRIA